MLDSSTAALMGYGLAGFLLAFKLLTLNREVSSGTFSNSPLNLGWGIHHDEKFAAHDAKVLALGKRYPGQLPDYRHYPVSAAFGLGGSLLLAFSFRLFGVNNFGLRVVLALLSSLSDFFMVALLNQFFPPALALGLSALYLLNFNHFIYSRHAVMEHFLFAACQGLFLVWGLFPGWLIANAFWIAAALGAQVFIKWSFPVASGLLLALLLLCSGAPVAVYAQALAGGLAGTAVIGAMQLVALRRLGLLDAYFLNIRTVFSYHAGKESLCDHVATVLGWRAIPKFVTEFVRYHCGLRVEGGDRWVCRAFIALLGAGVLGLILQYPELPVRDQRLAVMLALYHLLNFVMLAMFMVYLKRLVTIFPFSFMLLGLVIHRSGGWLMAQSALAGRLLPFLGWTILAYVLFKQFSMALSRYSRSRGQWLSGEALHAVAKTITAPVPVGEVLHVHGLAFRMLWRNLTHRVVGIDEQFAWWPLSFLHWAMKEKARWIVMPMLREQPLPRETNALLRRVTSVEVPTVAGDVPLDLVLYEVRSPYNGCSPCMATQEKTI
ncbi:MAG: hypothetical protein P4L39_10185 [Humidesulfovibrio sp.]|nr:hypothetical protein [Humidesulfovibrio sp.]